MQNVKTYVIFFCLLFLTCIAISHYYIVNQNINRIPILFILGILLVGIFLIALIRLNITLIFITILTALIGYYVPLANFFDILMFKLHLRDYESVIESIENKNIKIEILPANKQFPPYESFYIDLPEQQRYLAKNVQLIYPPKSPHYLVLFTFSYKNRNHFNQFENNYGYLYSASDQIANFNNILRYNHATRINENWYLLSYPQLPDE